MDISRNTHHFLGPLAARQSGDRRFRRVLRRRRLTYPVVLPLVHRQAPSFVFLRLRSQRFVAIEADDGEISVFEQETLLVLSVVPQKGEILRPRKEVESVKRFSRPRKFLTHLDGQRPNSFPIGGYAAHVTTIVPSVVFPILLTRTCGERRRLKRNESR